MLVGIDDAGRGSLAGPMIFCGILCKVERRLTLLGARDSKQTTPESRFIFGQRVEQKEDPLGDNVIEYVIAMAGPNQINQLGFTYAEWSKVASLVHYYKSKYGLELNIKIDGHSQSKLIPEEFRENLFYIARADRTEPVVSAASMLAKLKHDAWVEYISEKFPAWGFNSHRGYATQQHTEMIYEHGLIKNVHRIKPCLTTIKNFCKKKKLVYPEWYKECRHDEGRAYQEN